MPAKIDKQSDYALLDSGEGERLERFGDYLLQRPAPQAFWRKRKPASFWEQRDARYERSSKGGGRWQDSPKKRLPEEWTTRIHDIDILIRPTGFGHVGVFPEQLDNLRFMQQRIRANRCEAPLRVMNLFAYTGLATMVCAKEGAEICHLDASKGVVDWAREIALANGLENEPIRWMVEDVQKFVKREIKRGHRYDALILDPPTFGRGNKGEVWKIERDIAELLLLVKQLLSDTPDFVVMSTYSPKFTPMVLRNLLADAFDDLGGEGVGFEMLIEEADGKRAMPNGVTARWVFS